LNCLVHCIQLPLAYQRTHLHSGFEGVSELGLSHDRRDFLNERFRDRLLNIDAFGAIADLPAIDDSRVPNRFGSKIKIGIRHYNRGRLAAQFQGNLGDVIGCSPHDCDAARNATSKTDHTDFGMTCQRISDHMAEARYQVEHATRKGSGLFWMETKEHKR
jgi:hypothetical protein